MAALALFGWLTGAAESDGAGPAAVAGLMLGLVFGAAALAVERMLASLSPSAVAGGAVGAVAGIGAAGLFLLVTPSTDELLGWRFFLPLVGGYVGAAIGVRFSAGLLAGTESRPAKNPDPGDRRGRLVSLGAKILDTSVIIDGRIADLCETGFMEGSFILPQFILQELQHIADSSDSLKRARGRRGLDVLRKIQEMPGVTVKIVDDDFSQIREVDAKVVALAKKLGAKIVTNDLNLNKVASLQGVKVLNINELSNALRPVVLPGESMRVFVLKEGKEAGQGVAYLDDGTMVVVDDAKRLISKYIDVVVTSVLQTTAGRMIFARLREEPQE